MKKIKATAIAIIIYFLTLYYKLINYIRVTRGDILISPSDVTVDTSLLWKGEIAPTGMVFYIAKYKFRGIFYSKNVEINRKNIPPIYEVVVKHRVQTIFANTITKRVNK